MLRMMVLQELGITDWFRSPYMLWSSQAICLPYVANFRYREDLFSSYLGLASTPLLGHWNQPSPF